MLFLHIIISRLPGLFNGIARFINWTLNALSLNIYKKNFSEPVPRQGNCVIGKGDSLTSSLNQPDFKDIISQRGSTAVIARIQPGIVIKSPRFNWWHSDAAEHHPLVKGAKRNFDTEQQILEILGEHPRIVRFLGFSEVPRGLLFAEASHGDLQSYIDQSNERITLGLRLKWCSQAAEAIYYIHQKNVIHSDLRPDNYLLHSNATDGLDILLCDFGGSCCGAIDGGSMPDAGFFDPRKPWVSTEATDIFSLGSVFYTIMTGHWPFKSPGPFQSANEAALYEKMVDTSFAANTFPTTENLIGGQLIQGCWNDKYADVESLLKDQISVFRDHL